MKHLEVACAVIRHGGEILCMRRALKGSPSTAGKWEFPGGKLEPGEDAEACLRRELLEELDYAVHIERHLCTVRHQYDDFAITLHAYLCTAATRDFRRKEHIAHLWLPPHEMPRLDWCAADAPIVSLVTNY